MRITFLGDIMVQQEQYDAYRAGNAYDFDTPLRSIRSSFADSDYIVANLETPVAGADAGYTSEPYSFNTPAEILYALTNAGVDMAQTANNHCLDRGVSGLDRTVENIRKAGLAYLGTRDKPEDAFRIVTLGNIRVGFLAATYGTNAFINGVYLKADEAYKVDLLQEQELSGRLERVLYSRFLPARILRRGLRTLAPGLFAVPVHERREPSRRRTARLRDNIRKCREAGAEFIFVCLHIGGQYNPAPTQYTRETCEFCVDCGADAVIANHEHVAHPFYWGAQRKAFCAYSLGNFLSATGVLSGPWDQYANYSAVYHANLRRVSGAVRASYQFELFCSRQDERGRVVAEPAFQVWQNSRTEAERTRIRADCETLLRRIYRTDKAPFPMRPLYDARSESG